MGILSLPNELLLIIAQDLRLKDLYHFLSTCHHLSSLLTPRLHKLALQGVGALTALQWAARYGHVSLAELVLSKGYGGVRGLGSGKQRLLRLTALHMAAERNHADVIRVLVKHGERVTARTLGLNTPLHMAASQGSVHAIRVLLELGADLMAVRNKRGKTPGHIAAVQGHLESMKAFVDAGFDFYLEDHMGRTVLHEAVLNRKGVIVEFLLGHGAEKIINARDSTGQTPLHLAVFGSTADEEIVRLLCHHGADTEVADNLGNTPAGLAIDHCGFPLTIMLLECIPGKSGMHL